MKAPTDNRRDDTGSRSAEMAAGPLIPSAAASGESPTSESRAMTPVSVANTTTAPLAADHTMGGESERLRSVRKHREKPRQYH
jgi:hypothetical protein